MSTLEANRGRPQGLPLFVRRSLIYRSHCRRWPRPEDAAAAGAADPHWIAVTCPKTRRVDRHSLCMRRRSGGAAAEVSLRLTEVRPVPAGIDHASCKNPVGLTSRLHEDPATNRARITRRQRDEVRDTSRREAITSLGKCARVLEASDDHAFGRNVGGADRFLIHRFDVRHRVCDAGIALRRPRAGTILIYAAEAEGWDVLRARQLLRLPIDCKRRRR